MKKIIFLVMSIPVLLLVSCQPDPVDPPVESTLTKIQGKWKMDRAIDDYYHPATVLQETELYTGTPGDSIVFKINNVLHTYSPVSGHEQTEYYLVNDSTINIDGEAYMIRKLTSTELYLYQEELDPVRDEKFTLKGYFFR